MPAHSKLLKLHTLSHLVPSSHRAEVPYLTTQGSSRDSVHTTINFASGNAQEKTHTGSLFSHRSSAACVRVDMASGSSKAPTGLQTSLSPSVSKGQMASGSTTTTFLYARILSWLTDKPAPSQASSTDLGTKEPALSYCIPRKGHSMLERMMAKQKRERDQPRQRLWCEIVAEEERARVTADPNVVDTLEDLWLRPAWSPDTIMGEPEPLLSKTTIPIHASFEATPPLKNNSKPVLGTLTQPVISLPFASKKLPVPTSTPATTSIYKRKVNSTPWWSVRLPVDWNVNISMVYTSIVSTHSDPDVNAPKKRIYLCRLQDVPYLRCSVLPSQPGYYGLNHALDPEIEKEIDHEMREEAEGKQREERRKKVVLRVGFGVMIAGIALNFMGRF